MGDEMGERVSKLEEWKRGHEDACNVRYQETKKSTDRLYDLFRKHTEYVSEKFTSLWRVLAIGSLGIIVAILFEPIISKLGG